MTAINTEMRSEKLTMYAHVGIHILDKRFSFLSDLDELSCDLLIECRRSLRLGCFLCFVVKVRWR